jgi:hypothetical protein
MFFKIGQRYFVETGRAEGGIACYTGNLDKIEEEGEHFYKLTFGPLQYGGAFIYYVRRDGVWTRRNRVFKSVDSQGQDIRVSQSELIGSNAIGKKPGLEFNVNWTRKGIAPTLTWSGLRNGHWEGNDGSRFGKSVGRRNPQAVRR